MKTRRITILICFSLLLLLATVLVAVVRGPYYRDRPTRIVQTTYPNTSAGLTVPTNDPARGLIYDGLEPGTGDCTGTFQLKSDPTLCSHPDPGPEGVDVRDSSDR